MTGSGPIDADHAFAKAARARRRAAAVRWLRGEPAECGRLAVFEATEIPRAVAEIRRGIREIPLEAIRGTLEPSPGKAVRPRLPTRSRRPQSLAQCVARRTPRHTVAPDRRRPGRRRLRPTRRTPPGLSGHRPRRARDRRHRRGCRRRLRFPVALRSPVHPRRSTAQGAMEALEVAVGMRTARRARGGHPHLLAGAATTARRHGRRVAWRRDCADPAVWAVGGRARRGAGRAAAAGSSGPVGAGGVGGQPGAAGLA